MHSTLILPVILPNLITLSPVTTLVNNPMESFARKTHRSSLTFLLVNVNKLLFNSLRDVCRS